MDYTPAPNIETTLPGLTLASIRQAEDDGDTIQMETSDGRSFVLYHGQDCCESVRVYDIVGDLNALVGSPLTEAKESVVSHDVDSWDTPKLEDLPVDWPAEVKHPGGSATVTTFVFATKDARVTVRWLGSSNGYYSESVSFAETTHGSRPRW